MNRNPNEVILVVAVALAAVVAAAASPPEEFIVYQSDFEGDPGGWTGTGGWGWEDADDIAGAPLSECDDPLGLEHPGAASGHMLWSTAATDCYSNAPAGEVRSARLSQTFDLTDVRSAKLYWNQQLDLGAGDAASLLVNGMALRGEAGPVRLFDGWDSGGASEDLRLFDGQSNVQVAFEMTADDSGNGGGWFIDDVMITSIVNLSGADNDVAVYINADQREVDVGDTVRLTITTINQGSVDLANVQVIGIAGEQGQFSFNATESDPDIVVNPDDSFGLFYEFSIGSLGARSFRETVLALNTEERGAGMVLVSSIPPGDTNFANSNDSETIYMGPQPDLSVDIESNVDPAVRGTNVTYTTTITNQGHADALDVPFAIGLSTGQTFVSTTLGAPNPSGSLVTGTIPTVAVGQIVIVEVTAAVEETIPSGETLFASAGAAAGDPNPENDFDTETIRHIGPDEIERLSSVVYSTTAADDAFGILPTADVPDQPGTRILDFSFSDYVAPRIGFTWDWQNGTDVFDAVGTSTEDRSTHQTLVQEGVTTLDDGPGQVCGQIYDFAASLSASYAFTADFGGVKSLVRGGGGDPLQVHAHIGQPVPGLTGAVYQDFVPLNVRPNTLTAYVATSAPDSFFYSSSIPFAGPVDPLIQAGVTVPTGQSGGTSRAIDAFSLMLPSWEWGLQESDDGQHLLVAGTLEGDPATSGFLATWDLGASAPQIRLQQGSTYDTLSSPVESIQDADLAENGSWAAVVRTADGNQAVIRDGLVAAELGGPIVQDRTWTEFYEVSINDAIPLNWIVKGRDDSGRDVLAEVNGAGEATVIAREDDPLDLNGDGAFEEHAFVASMNTGDKALSLDERKRVFSTFWKRAQNPEQIQQAGKVVLSRVLPGGLQCPCDLDLNGIVDVFDLLTYLTLWFDEDPAADLVADGVIGVFDLLAYLTCWFDATAGQCQ